MDDRIRQRLVGAIVLVALGVIFLPMLFDTPNRGWLGEDRPLIPEPPQELQKLAEAAPAPLPPPEPEPPSPDTQNSEGSSQSPAAVEPEPVAKLPAPSSAPRAMESDPQLMAWAVQVGSFSSDTNAKRLRDRLRKLGFRAYTEVLKEKGKQVTRVRVGPELDEATARKLRDRLKAKAKIDGIVVRHR